MKIITIFYILSVINANSNYTKFDHSQLDSNSVLEQFDYNSLKDSPWKVSNAKKFDQGRDEIVRYTGKWSIEPSYKYPAFINDKGLVMKSKANHYSISYKLPNTINNINQDLVLQYEVKLQNGFDCSGAYIKLLDESPLGYLSFSSETPYQIMFGPDKCGSENKVHLIFRKLLPNGLIEEKHLKQNPMARINDLTNLYTLIVRKNSDFEIRINGEVAKAGNLIKNSNLFNPPIFPPTEIIDENDEKPLDWDDKLYIADPNSKKPIDYDDKYAYPTIPDPNAEKPDEWNESEPIYIQDPKSDDQLIVNPKCEHGCGPWSPPRIPNKDYKGPWFPEQILNPNYKGVWEPRKIKNPDYYENDHPGQLDKPIGGIGFELWTMDSGILFDNIYLGNSNEEAELIGNQTFKIKQELENENRRNNRPKIKHEPVPPPINFDEMIEHGHYFQFWSNQYVDFKDFWYQFLRNPFKAVTKSPIKSLIYSSIFMISFTICCGFGNVLLFLFHSGGSSNDIGEDEEVDKEIIEEEDKEVIIKEDVEIVNRKKVWFILTGLLSIVSVTILFAKNKPQLLSNDYQFGPTLSLRLYTNNIRFDNRNYRDKHERLWEKRKIQSINSMEFNTLLGHANIICLQEVLHNQLVDILEGLNSNDNNEWTYYGVGRTDGIDKGEFAPILFKSKDFLILENTTFWLSEMPEFPSKGWDAALERIVTLVTFQSKVNPLIKFNIFNTHYDHRGKLARRQSSKLIVDKMKNYNDYPSFLCGDFNTEPKDEPYHILTNAGFKDSRALIDYEFSYGYESTFTGFDRENEPFSIIDYIWSPYFTKQNNLATTFEMNNYYNLDHHDYYDIVLKQFGILGNWFKGFYFSDHRPVVATYELRRTKLI
ncbi:unnamed protein product [Candida verbasci]|uniref:Endonuclease/exonuclease/phosphatase domain-containing protein n=1 Tax=Candida verbasci TaxID=1227364 RepID=A0A9W4TXM2_9ASCO|nr:unnamed protein product [Candida verbasci]